VHPVSCVSWNDAVAYTRWLSSKSGRAYRLPSSSEWEYAARAGSSAAQAWGANSAAACAYANVADQNAAQRFPGWSAFDCSDGYVGTAPVGSFKANAFGLNDTLGNVFEWVQDCWHDDYQHAPRNGSARLDGDCRAHEARGGSWFTPPEYVTLAYRNRFDADQRSTSVGFRVVREIGR
jgi:formylglycine-generating enzyme